MKDQGLTSFGENGELIAWINVVMKEKNWNPREWSMLATGKPDTVRNILRGGSKAPRIDTLYQLASVAGVQPPWGALEVVPPAPANDGPQDMQVAPTTDLNIRAMPQDMPVRGSAACGPNGLFEMQGQVLEYVRRPPRLMNVKDAYALYCLGESMRPWREHGQLVYVHPHQPVNIGDYVVVQLTPAGDSSTPEAYIKRLVRRTSDHLVVHQYNPEDDLRIPAKKVKAIHRIVDWSELMGI